MLWAPKKVGFSANRLSIEQKNEKYASKCPCKLLINSGYFGNHSNAKQQLSGR